MTTLELFNSDCLLKLRDIPDKSISLILCDLPYGQLATKQNNNITLKRIENGVVTGKRAETPNGFTGGCAWDVKIDLDEFWKQVKRIRKNDKVACIHFCNTRFGYDLIHSNEAEFRYDLVWSKVSKIGQPVAVGFLSANKKPMSSHEMIYVFSKKSASYNRIDIEGDFGKWLCGKNGKRTGNHADAGLPKQNISGGEGKRCPTSVIECVIARSNQKGEKKEHKHPTEKPKKLYEWLISRYSNPGDTILDPTFGSCNSGEVARELGRNFIGCEMNKEFYDKAVERLLAPTNA